MKDKNRINLDKKRIIVPGRPPRSDADGHRDNFQQLDIFQEAAIAVQVQQYEADRARDQKANQVRAALEAETVEANRATLLKRAKRKDVTREVNRHLLKLKESPLQKYYQRAGGCGQVIMQQGTKLVTRYCQCKHCLVCVHIRTAKLISKYLYQLQQFDDPHMVTLTYPDGHVTDRNLNFETKSVIEKWRKVYKHIRHKWWNREGIEIKGFRGLESTGDWNRKQKRHKYHPHLHIIVDGYAVAKDIQQKWLELNPGATEINQRIVPADERGMKEILKYFTKFVDKKYRTVYTRQGKRKRICYKKEINIHRLDVMMQSMFKLRLFNSFGIKGIPDVEDETECFEDLEAQNFADLEAQVTKWLWNHEAKDWVDIQSGECLTGNERSLTEQELIEAIRPCSNRKLVLMKSLKKVQFLSDA